MTTEERLQTLEKEMAREKKRVRWLLLAGVAWAVAFGVFCARTAVVKEVRANGFLLVDKNGKERAVLGMSQNQVAFGLLDERGERRVGLVLDGDGAWFNLYDKGGEVRASFKQDEESGPGFLFLDERGTPRVGLNVTEDLAIMGFLDKQGNAVWSASDDPDKPAWSAP